ncbi:hypothetical protein DXX99_09240 [Ammonifex thiophilus]|uniref:Uncharacterized protein n=2 Tax=Ammonifex thiophilus TaxID=444093 RepID=A0A3D8P2U8_9THEO|nr:hypothetical protein DXX99_09240 [Ammonifex thiophilus]
MGIRDALKKIKEGSGLGFIAGREKGEIDSLLNRDITIEELAFVTSKFEGKENAIFIVKEEPKLFFRTGSDTAVKQLRILAEGLEEDDLDWEDLIVRFERVKSKQGRKYYVIQADLKPEAEAKLVEREKKGKQKEDVVAGEDDIPF